MFTYVVKLVTETYPKRFVKTQKLKYLKKHLLLKFSSMRNKEAHKGVWGMRHLQNWANIAWPIIINPKRGDMSKTMMRFSSHLGS